jgi:ADP-heptose:LPS heptosyltransferase
VPPAAISLLHSAGSNPSFENSHPQTQFARRRHSGAARAAFVEAAFRATPKFSGGLTPRWRRSSKAIPTSPASSASNAGAGPSRSTGRKCSAASAGSARSNFDLVIDLQCLARSGAFAWLANGKFLVGLDEVREGARGFYDLAVPAQKFLHARRGLVSRRAAAARRARSQKFHLAAGAPGNRRRSQIKMAAGFFPGAKRPLHPAGLLQPGARWNNKRWPVETFCRTRPRTRQKIPPNTRFAILGGKDDRPLGEVIARSAPERCLNLCGATSLPEMVEWIRRCDLMVTNDTGPMHAAAALGKPLVALFGPTEPRRTGPYGQLENALRARSPLLALHEPM